MFTIQQVPEIYLLFLCIWREARGETYQGKLGVGWCIRNRALKDGKQWYGNSWEEVILKPFQFSSFNAGDPNAIKFPAPGTPEYAECLKAAHMVYTAGVADPTEGATYYYDDSLKDNPPKWAAALTPTTKLGRLNFFKEG